MLDMAQQYPHLGPRRMKCRKGCVIKRAANEHRITSPVEPARPVWFSGEVTMEQVVIVDYSHPDGPFEGRRVSQHVRAKIYSAHLMRSLLLARNPE